MKKTKKRRFEDLIHENKQALLNDPKEMERIELRLDKKHQDRLDSAL
ncbi:FbpB family small basic protein [Alteribacter aurantiacus]|nr:FbpB family small basic protein [Alteribacter aurantiacus]